MTKTYDDRVNNNKVGHVSRHRYDEVRAFVAFPWLAVGWRSQFGISLLRAFSRSSFSDLSRHRRRCRRRRRILVQKFAGIY